MKIYCLVKISTLILGVLFIFSGCNSDPLECFDTPPSFCNAQVEFISFEADGKRFRFCQSTMGTALAGNDSSFLLKHTPKVKNTNGNIFREAPFFIPDLFFINFHVPNSVDDYLLDSNIGSHTLNFVNGADELFSAIIFFTRNCNQDYSSVYNTNISENFNKVSSIELIRTFTQGDSTVSEFKVKGTFGAELSRSNDREETLRLSNGKYELLLQHFEGN